MQNEQRLQCHATVALHEGVEQVLKMFGVNGWLANVATGMPGGGNAAIVGDPDLSWVIGCTGASAPETRRMVSRSSHVYSLNLAGVIGWVRNLVVCGSGDGESFRRL